MKALLRCALVLGCVAGTVTAAEAQPNRGMMGPNAGPGMMGLGAGYGMMGPGMMGFGMGGMMGARNRACNEDGSVPDFGFRRNTNALNLNADDVKNYVASAIAWDGNPHLKLGAVKERDGNTVTAEIVTKDNSLVEAIAFDRRSGFSCFLR